MRILLVEDNRTLSDWLGRLLGARNYTVDRVFDGEEAEAAMAAFRYNLVILDLGLPRLDGRELLRRLRARGDATSVLILSASDGLDDRVNGLDLGADDYLAKPFEPDELEARVRALLRRSQGFAPPLVQTGALDFDSTTRTFKLQGVDLQLTPRERSVLEMLILRRGGIVAKDRLAEAVFGFNDEASPTSIEIYVHRIRKKLAGSNVEIATLRGIGYALRVIDVRRG